MGGARVTTLVTLRKCTLGNKREIKTLKFVLASTKGFKGGLAWIKPSKKDMAVTFSYFLHCLVSTPPFSICALHSSPHLQVPFTAWSPDIRRHAKRKYKPRPRLPEEHAEPPRGPGGDQPAGTGGEWPPSEARSVRSEASRRSGRSGGSEASTATAHVVREVVVPMPSCDELGEAHTDPPLDQVTLAARQPDPAWTQQVPPGPDGRQRHLSAVWDMVLESRGVHPTFRISFPCPIVVRGGANLPAGQELVGMFAYRLVSGHWRVQTGVSRIGEEETVTMAVVFGLNVLTRVGSSGGRSGRTWHGLPCASMWGGSGRWGWLTSLTSRSRTNPPPAPPKGTPSPAPPKAARTATPAERAVRAEQAEPVAGLGQKGVVQEWVEQQRAGAWEAARSARRPPTATSRPVCRGPTRKGGTPSRGRRTSPRSVIVWPPR